MPTSFAVRSYEAELMDDFSITDDRLVRALDHLRHVNRWLGGYAVTRRALRPLLRQRQGGVLSMLDLGTGIADYPEHLVRWADAHGVSLHVTALDANPLTAELARSTLDARLPSELRARITVDVADAAALPYAPGSFDVAHAALFLHHFEAEQAAAMLQSWAQVAREGIIINDLHRHPLAYYSIKSLATLLRASPMFRHDAPLSVLRAFRRDELRAIAEAAGITTSHITWHWPFRWALSTIGKGA